MSDHGYEKGRLNLPFVGICTFGKYPYESDWNNIDADIAILGAPFDCGSQWRSGSRMGPRGIREASTLYSFGHNGAYDVKISDFISDHMTLLPGISKKVLDGET